MMTYSTDYNIRYHFSDKMKILFVGINPHPGSDRRGVPFSNNKTFWYLLSDAGLIARERSYLKVDRNLKDFYDNEFTPTHRLGFVNLIDRPTEDVTMLHRDEEIAGRERALDIIDRYRPAVVAFIGKVTYRKFAGLHEVDFGWTDDVGDSRAYVLHFPIRGKASVRVEELELINASASGVPR